MIRVDLRTVLLAAGAGVLIASVVPASAAGSETSKPRGPGISTRRNPFEPNSEISELLRNRRQNPAQPPEVAPPHPLTGSTSS